MSKPPLLGLVRKEAHALWPVWAGGAVACMVVATTGLKLLATPGWLAYFFGSVALAALSIGHEYTHGTLATLLTLPVDRRRLVAAKLLAVLPMLATLALIALGMRVGALLERDTVIGGLSVLAAAALAPWLTMVCRSPLAGAVFALGIAGFMQVASLGVVLAWSKVVFHPALDLQAAHDRVLAAGLVAIAVGGAVAGWRAFIGLEANDGHDLPLTWPRWLRSSMVLVDEGFVAPARRSFPYWLLIKKEVRIQQMAFAVAAVNLLIWILSRAIVGPGFDSDGVLAVLAILYGGLLALLIGALASAEERHLGTLEWQTLLPVAAWRQFAVKTAVALTCSLVLAFALPIVLARGELPVTAIHAGAVILLTIGSLFVSSRCDSPVTALALSASGLFVLAAMVGWSSRFLSVNPTTALVIVAALVALAWWSAFVNHRSARA